jgi:hypothetical protein
MWWLQSHSFVAHKFVIHIIFIYTYIFYWYIYIYYIILYFLIYIKYYIILYDIILYYIILYYIVLYYIISYYNYTQLHIYIYPMVFLGLPKAPWCFIAYRAEPRHPCICSTGSTPFHLQGHRHVHVIVPDDFNDAKCRNIVSQCHLAKNLAFGQCQ